MTKYLHLFSLPSIVESAEFMVLAFKVQAKAGGRQHSDKLDDRAGKFKKHLDRYPKKK